MEVNALPNTEADTAQIRYASRYQQNQKVRRAKLITEAQNKTGDYKETARHWLNFQYIHNYRTTILHIFSEP